MMLVNVLSRRVCDQNLIDDDRIVLFLCSCFASRFCTEFHVARDTRKTKTESKKEREFSRAHEDHTATPAHALRARARSS